MQARPEGGSKSPGECLRLLTLGKFYFPRTGGIEIITRTIAEEAALGGARSTVFCFDPHAEGVETLDGVTVRRFRAGQVGPAPVSWRFLMALPGGAGDCDVLLLHYPNPLAELGRWLLGRRSFRTIVFYHSDLAGFHPIVDRIYWAFSRHVLRRADSIITTSPEYAGGSPVLRAMGSRITVVPLATDTGRFHPDGSRAAIDVRFERRILFVGRFARFKGLEILLEALTRLPVSYGAVLVGDGPARPGVERRIATLGLADRVHLAGDIPNEELPSWYRACDVFVLPSTLRSESFGVVALEAMASGLPVVTTRLGTGTTLYNEDGVTGRVVAPRDAGALAAAIEECWERRLELGAAARAAVTKDYSIERFRRDVRRVIGLPRPDAVEETPS